MRKRKQTHEPLSLLDTAPLPWAEHAQGLRTVADGTGVITQHAAWTLQYQGLITKIAGLYVLTEAGRQHIDSDLLMRAA